MSENILEQDLKLFDYSSFREIRESLLQELLQRHRRDNAQIATSLFRTLRGKRLADYELDYVAAAGNPYMKPAEFGRPENLFQHSKK